MTAPLEIKTPWRKAIRLDGVNQFVGVSMNNAGIPQHWTGAYFGFWAKPTGATGERIIGDSSATSGNAIDIGLPWNTSLEWQFGDLTGSSTLGVAWDVSWDSQWAWWEFTSREGPNQMVVYRNGVQLGSNGNGYWYNTHGNAELFIGKFGGGNFWRGAVRNVVVKATTFPTDEQRERFKNGWTQPTDGVNMFLPLAGNTTAKVGPNGTAGGNPLVETWQPPQLVTT